MGLSFRLELMRCRWVERFERWTGMHRVVSYPEGAKVNLGCGQQYLEGWVNVDSNPGVTTDLACDFRELPQYFPPGSLAVIQMIHSISYLRYWEAQDFFRGVHTLLQPKGCLILEFPDIEKCARRIRFCHGELGPYLEAVRAIYAFDLDQIRCRESYIPYHFGWSAWHINEELRQAGFSRIRIRQPQTHGPRFWRDTRVEAIK